MATLNPFDLLGDDDTGDVAQLIAIQQEKPAVAPADKQPANLPSKPAPPALAAKEAKSGGVHGGHGGGRGYGRRGEGGYNKDFASKESSFSNNGFSGGQGATEGSYSGRTAERRGGYVGPRSGFRGGRRGGDEGEENHNRREFERRSGTGHGNEYKREGAGRGNWGTPTDEISQVTEENAVEGVKSLEAEKPSGEEDVINEDKDTVEKEPENKEMTLEEYEKVLEEKRKAFETLKNEARKVEMDEELASMHQLSSKKSDDEIFAKLGFDKDKRKDIAEKEERAKKLHSRQLTMVNDAPHAQPNGPEIPEVAAPPPAAPAAIAQPAAPVAPAAAHRPVAPPPKRNRHPQGTIPANSTAGTSPALLEIASATPMYTEQRASVNKFVPDAQYLFHVLGLCDQMMNSTERFTHTTPAWIPIVSQLYVSVLWLFMIISVTIDSSYGMMFNTFYQQLKSVLRIDDCMIPGPLVPFFQSLAAINGPYEWISDFYSTIPSPLALWNAANFRPVSHLSRIVPIPAILLDQLYAFSQFAPAANADSTYFTFEWYRNVFSLTNANVDPLLRIGPQLCGSLHTDMAQYDSARLFWNSRFEGNFTRINAANNQPQLVTYNHLLGFASPTGTSQHDWFSTIATIMSKYAQFFNGSVPLKSISTRGIGSVAINATAFDTVPTRNWLYPPAADIAAFTTARFLPRREIPSGLLLQFTHGYPELEEQAEQFGIIACTNIKWTNIPPQNNWVAINDALTHSGSYWNQPTFRFSIPINLKNQYHQVVSSRYHQQYANTAT